MYRHRLESIGPLIINPSPLKYASVRFILEIKSDVSCFLVGTIYTKNKQSIMDNETGTLGSRKDTQRIPTSYWIEDFSGRICI